MATITLPPPNAKYTFSILINIFKQALADTDADTFDYAKENFGLIQQSYPSDASFEDVDEATPWQRLEHYIRELNKNAENGVEYKVLYLGRHGQGYHNAAETRYGTKLWDSYWAKQEGDEYAHWADSHLTPLGEQQALDVHAFWTSALTQAKVPAPETYYTSPFYRCLQTSWLSFHNLSLPEDKPFTPIVKELLRETNGVHTCDRRGPSSIIRKDFPSYTLEPGLPETDVSWTPGYREKPAEHILREHLCLEEIWEGDEKQFLSVTAHSGTIAAVLGAVGHRRFALPTGGVIPIAVKGARVRS
ncbi:phosphoglycerate mutase family protein [Aureobasidium sp. EXF-8845]|nr:phosphoglycerate mutase family protein [Aureobasidium sp. EXF-8845]KAI4856425.1 phosphoglycerate mutase family protein [Aureobasidium sp. EXF-8846]